MRTMVGGTVVTQMRPDVGDQVDIRVIAADAAQRSADQIAVDSAVRRWTAPLVRLDQVAQIVRDAARPASSAPTASASSTSRRT